MIVLSFTLLLLASPPGMEQVGDEFRFDLGAGAGFVYVRSDPKIPRPYLAHVKAPGGVQVTRNHPPVEGTDLTDHDTIHPGIWLSFGDLNGADFWRNQARVVVEEASGEMAEDGTGRLQSRNRYESDGQGIAEEEFDLVIHRAGDGYWLHWSSTFRGDKELVFGDQEEMGLGVRMATPLMVKSGGTMTNSNGQENEKGPNGVWGKQADWLDYSKTIDGRRVGILFIPHPDNPRRSYFHARDYGMMTANMFGERAFTGSGDGSYRVPAGEPIRMRYSLFIYNGDIDPAKVVREILPSVSEDRP